jgi:hypothetical protein
MFTEIQTQGSTNSFVTGSNHRMIWVDLGDEDPRVMIPLALGHIEGLQSQRIRPGEDLERPDLPIAWFVIVDDRPPGASGPSSFDADMLRWLFADAFKIVVDAAEPFMRFYEYFVEEGLKGQRILVIHTTEVRREEWREFSRKNCDLYGVLEITAVTNDPKRMHLPKVTRFR